MLLLTGRWVLGGWVLWRFHYPSVFLPRKLLQTLGVEIDFFGFNIQLVLLSSHHSHSVWVLLGGDHEETHEDLPWKLLTKARTMWTTELESPLPETFY
ncbi:hypothetical protein NC652_002752 [Populus alba x Populus x berolinensis]|nr:hypothetical protein NC652_002752 [Populus alba x Populus x berolinensis]